MTNAPLESAEGETKVARPSIEPRSSDLNYESGAVQTGLLGPAIYVVMLDIYKMY